MNILDLAAIIDGRIITDEAYNQKTISGLYTCDMLSWAMAKVSKDDAWVTIVNNRNIVAVSVLVEAACVIVSEDVEVEQAVVDKANDEGIPIVLTSLSSYEVCARYSKAV